MALDRRFEAQKEELEKLITTYQQQQDTQSAVQENADFKWLCWPSSGTALCEVCSEYADRLPLGEVSSFARQSAWLKKNGGVSTERESGRAGFNKSVKSHLGCLLHSACVDARAEDEKQRNALLDTFAAAADREMATMKRLFICLHVIVQEKRSLHSFETLVHALDECGTDVGHKEHSRKT